LQHLIDEDRLLEFDALSVYQKYTDLFEIDDVPEAERREVARQVADSVSAALEKDKQPPKSD